MKKALVLAVTLLASLPAFSKVSFSSVIGSNMVLQQESEVRLWGKALPGRTVTLSASWAPSPVSVIAGPDGYWEVCIDTPSYGGPYTITANDTKKKKNATVLENILIGEVWLCSGQSNMEMCVRDSREGVKEIANASDYPEIRLLRIANKTSAVPLDEAEIWNGGWQVCSSETIPVFSAIAYFYAKELYDRLGIPVGLVESCWGGTTAEAWSSEEWIAKMPAFSEKVEALKALPDHSAEYLESKYEKEIIGWNEMMVASYDKIDEETTVLAHCPGMLQDQGLGSSFGTSFYRKEVEIPAEWEGKDLTLNLQGIDDYDFTFFGGSLVGHNEDCTAYRSYKVPGSLVKAGKTEIAIRLIDTGGLGGINADPATFGIFGPDGGFVSLVGEWKYNFLLPIDETPEIPVNLSKSPYYPSVLYNAMIHPLLKMKIKGVVWYQGESNVEYYDRYADQLMLLISDWRENFGYDFPFYICQIANFLDVQTGAEDTTWARLREAQVKALALEGTGLACLIDIGEADNIHPRNKQEAARRIALPSLVKTYGLDLVYSGPMMKSWTSDGRSIKVEFDFADGGLTAKGEKLEGFYVAGVDHVFHKAEAEIDGSSVIVRAEEVDFPVAVRYGWANCPVCNLYNGAGLPAVPFRTDFWPLR